MSKNLSVVYTTKPHQPRTSYRRVNIENLALIVILWIAAFFRWYSQASMFDMLNYDEAFNGVNAWSLLQHWRITPFFDDNYGRESGWMYLQAFFLWGLGKTIFSIRILPTFIGILSVSAHYQFAKQLFGRPVGIWTAAATAILFWDVQISQMSLRANLLPLIGALSCAALWRAYRVNTKKTWLMASLWLGCLAYTYFSARVWIFYLYLTLFIWFLLRNHLRKPIVITGLLALGLMMPLIAYIWLYPNQSLERFGQVAMFDLNAIINNGQEWLKAFVYTGDKNINFNLPSRPIFDLPLGLLFSVGLLISPVYFWRVKRPYFWRYIWLIGLALFSITPSLLSNYAPHFLRGIGLVVPLALLMGLGAHHLTQGLLSISKIASRWQIAYLLPVGLLFLGASHTFYDFHTLWMGHVNVISLMEQRINQMFRVISGIHSEKISIYFVPLAPDHPNLRFFSDQLPPTQRLNGFDSNQCLVIDTKPSIYAALTTFEPDFEKKLNQFANVNVLKADALPVGSDFTHVIYSATVHSDIASFSHNSHIFKANNDDTIVIEALKMNKHQFKAGETLNVQMKLQAQNHIQQPYSLFIHIYQHQRASGEFKLFGQGDQQLCASYPTVLWQPSEIVLQHFTFNLPADIPAGDYDIAIGIYAFPNGTRMEAQNKQTDRSFVVIDTITTLR